MKNLFTLFISLIFTCGVCYAQSISVFDVDTSSFPIMKAKFIALDAEENQILNINQTDLSLTEDGKARFIEKITCPPDTPPERLSSTIVIDLSGSMSGAPLEMAKTIAREWVNALLLGQSECAITTFNDINYFNQDFTTDRSRLTSCIDGLTTYGSGTNYDAALIEPIAGGVLVAKTGKFKKVIIFITDGQPNNLPNVYKIVSEANAAEITIHCVAIGMPAHESMKTIAAETGGYCFDNARNVEDAQRIAQILILHTIKGGDPCELQWKSDNICNHRYIKIDLHWNSLSANANYYAPESGISALRCNPIGVKFINKPIGIKADTTIYITAVNSDYHISNFITSNHDFSITPSNIVLLKGDTKSLTLSYTPTDSSTSFTKIDITNDKCPEYYYAGSSYPNGRLTTTNLKITTPNGGEEFLVGTDTLITWEGVLPEDTVTLEYSYDHGTTWNLISDEASGLKHVWKKVPKPKSNHCLSRVSLNEQLSGYGVDIEWEKIFGGSGEDYAKDVKETTNGYIVVGETHSTDGDVTGNIGKSNVWILYLNKKGEIIWKKIFGGTNYECGYSIKEMNNGDFVIGATAISEEIAPPPLKYSSQDFWLIRINVKGDIIWSKRTGGENLEWLYYVLKTDDDGIIAIGSSSSNTGDVSGNHGIYDAWVVKLDTDGKLEWQKSLGGSNSDCGYSATLTSDNCIVIVGTSSSQNGDVNGNKGREDGWILKLRNDGNLIWSKTFGGPGNDYILSVKETKDLGFIVSGYTNSNSGDIANNHGDMDALVAKFDANGSIQWIKSYGGSKCDEAFSIIETRNDGYIFTGSTQSSDGDIINPPKTTGVFHHWMVKLNTSGMLQWLKIFDNQYLNRVFSVEQTEDNGFITAGYSIKAENESADMRIVKFYPEHIFQSDVSDSLFSIVAPTVAACNIDMGQVVLGSYKDSVITAFIKNTSKYDCQIKDIKSAAKDFYVISNPAFTLKGNTEQAIEIHFKPSKLGKIYSNINIVTQDTSFAQSIEGEGVQPTLQINTALIDFGKVSVGEQKDTAIVLLENISGGPIDISDVKLLGPDTKQFEILEGGGAFTLGGGSTRELKLRFKPVYIGRTSCMLGFYHNGANSPAKAQLYGQGVGGLVSVSNDSAYAGENVKINMVLSYIAPSSLQNVVSSFRVKLKYLTAPLSLVNTALKIGETSDSTIIEVKGTIGSDSVLYSIDYVANDTPSDFTTIDLEEIKWYDAGGNEIEYEAETQNGSFKLLKYLGMAKVYCTSDSALPGETTTLKLKTFGIDPVSFKEIAPKFKATLRYQKTLLATIDKSLTVNYVGDSAFVQVTGDVVDSDELASIDFIAGLGAVDSTTIDIVEIKWLNSRGEEVSYETLTEGGLFKLLGVCREGGARLFNPTGKAGIEELSPNPARDEINVTVNQTEEGRAFISIYDILGNEMDRIIVTNETLGQKEIKIDLTKFSRGTYYLKYQTSTTVDARRFVVE